MSTAQRIPAPGGAGGFVPANLSRARNFLAIVSESGFDVALHQFDMTADEGRAIVAWGAARGDLNATVVILDDDPETEDFRTPDPGPSPAGTAVGSARPRAADGDLLRRARDVIRDLIDACASAQKERDELRDALRCIAEGNLGDASWQANYKRIRAYAASVLARHEGGRQ